MTLGWRLRLSSPHRWNFQCVFWGCLKISLRNNSVVLENVFWACLQTKIVQLMFPISSPMLVSNPLLYNNLYAHSQWIGGSATCRTTRVSEPPGHWGTRLGPSKGFDDWHETEYVLGCHSRWQTGSFKLDSEKNVIRSRYHNCGDILEVAVRSRIFPFQIGIRQGCVSNSRMVRSIFPKTMGKNSKTFCKTKFERTDAHCHLQLVFLNIQC